MAAEALAIIDGADSIDVCSPTVIMRAVERPESSRARP